MNYQEWLEENYEDLTTECAESGANDELDFDFDQFCENKYEQQLGEKDYD